MNLKKLDEVYEECNVPNWDGYGAAPLKEGARDQVIKFLEELDPEIQPPDIFPVNNGSMGLDWNRENNTFTVTLDDEANLIYAGILDFGGDFEQKFSGRMKFYDLIPDEICRTLFTHFSRE